MKKITSILSLFILSGCGLCNYEGLNSEQWAEKNKELQNEINSFKSDEYKKEKDMEQKEKCTEYLKDLKEEYYGYSKVGEIFYSSGQNSCMYTVESVNPNSGEFFYFLFDALTNKSINVTFGNFSDQDSSDKINDFKELVESYK